MRNPFARTTAEVTLQEPRPSAGAETLRPSADLGTLIRQAQAFGRPWVWMQEFADRRFWVARIDFDTIPGTSLHAVSKLEHATPEAAVEEALEKARTIMAQFK